MQDQTQLRAASGQDRPGAHTVLDFFTSVTGVTFLLILAMVCYPEWPWAVRLGLLSAYMVIWLAPGISDHSSIIFRCILPILIGFACVEAYNIADRMNIDLTYVRLHSDYRESFYGGISTLYAIITALALVKGIEDFDAMKRNIAEEAHKVRAITEMTHYFDGSKRAETNAAVRALKAKLLRYAKNVAAMRDQSLRSENLKLLRDCQRDICNLTPEGHNDGNSLGIIMEAHGELGTLRARRINSVGEKIPRYLIWALWIMALGLILPFMANPLGDPDPRVLGRFYIIFLMGALNSFLLLMLADISDPFDGFWKVNMEPFRDLAHALEEELVLESPVVLASVPQA